MKKIFSTIPLLLLFIINLSGCSTIGGKSGRLSFIYGATAIISLFLLLGCIKVVHQKKLWFITLFSSVLVTNTGYTFLSVSSNLEVALWANRIAYLGSVFLPMSMLMIILNVTRTPYKKYLSRILLIAAIIIFLIAATPGILPIYYKEVTFEIVNGTSTLAKVYGPLHPLYLIYLLSYFAAMVIIIIRANIKKTIHSISHAIIIAIAVFVNIGVWLIEQLVNIDFEFLSVSYIISELFLLGVHLVMNENQHLREIVNQVESAKNYSYNDTLDETLENSNKATAFSPENIEFFITGLKTLTPTEKKVFDAYIARLTTNEILAQLNIKENTLKYHNRNLYGKLGVSTRKELLELHKQIKTIKSKLNTTTPNDVD